MRGRSASASCDAHHVDARGGDGALVSSRTRDIDPTLDIPIRDVNDIAVIQTAIAGHAEIVCSMDAHFYDKEILTFSAHNGIRILRDVELIRLIRMPSEKA